MKNKNYKIVDLKLNKLHSLKGYSLENVKVEIRMLNDIEQDYRYIKLLVN